MRTILSVLLLGLLVSISLIGLAAYVTFNVSVPLYEGTIRMEKMGSNVNIKWDEYQVPHIFADNEKDLYFAIGYIHAQERLWQMTIMQMTSEGRSAEFLGEGMLEIDKHIRTIGIPSISKRIAEQLPEDERERLTAYADGVNAWIENNPDKLPMEFVLLDIDPIPWEIHHSIGAWRLLAWEMNQHWHAEITYAYLRTKLGETIWRELLPSYTGSYVEETFDASDQPGDSLSLQAGIGFLNSDQSLREVLGSFGSVIGSNAWALSGSRTTSGFPILAADPHMGLSLPGRFYELHLNRSGQNVSGASIPGIPYVFAGQNDRIAWGLTNLMADQTDFFEERILPGNPGLYQASSTDSSDFKSIRLERQIIKVKGKSDYIHSIRSTENGPLIQSVHPDSSLLNPKAVSMRWVGSRYSNELTALYQLNWVDQFENIDAIAAQFKVPGMNLIYADVTGNIAHFVMADIPIRNYDPIGISPGWISNNDWVSSIAYESLPHVKNPLSGMVLNANQSLGNVGFYMSHFEDSDSRFKVLKRKMEAIEKVSIEEVKKLQLDNESAHAQDIVTAVLPILRRAPQSVLMRDAVNYLLNWDYRFDRSATAATIFEVYLQNVTKNTLKDEMGEQAWQAFTRLDQLPNRVIHRMILNNSRYFNDINSVTTENRDSVIIQSMYETVRELSDTLGTQPINWRWEIVHQVEFISPLLTKIARERNSTYMMAIANYMMNRGPFGHDGHSTSPNNGQLSWASPYRQISGASIRRVVDLSETSQSWSVIPGGQSGNPLSKNYDDQLEFWLEGKYRIFLHNSEVRFSDQYPELKLIPK